MTHLARKYKVDITPVVMVHLFDDEIDGLEEHEIRDRVVIKAQGTVTFTLTRLWIPELASEETPDGSN